MKVRPTAGAHYRPDAYDANSTRVDSLDERELGANVLFAGLLLAPLVIVFGIVFFYLALVV